MPSPNTLAIRHLPTPVRNLTGRYGRESDGSIRRLDPKPWTGKAERRQILLDRRFAKYGAMVKAARVQAGIDCPEAALAELRSNQAK